jgi:hypothetical protein
MEGSVVAYALISTNERDTRFWAVVAEQNAARSAPKHTLR